MRFMESAAAAAAIALAIGCTASDETSTPATDATADSSAVDTATVDTASPDTAPDDTMTADTTAPDTMTPDSPPVDSTTPDTMMAVDSAIDTAKADTTMTDTTVVDTAMTDTAVAETVMDVASDGSVNCGSPPYQLFDPVAAYMPTGMPMADVTITTNICAGASVVVPYMKTRTMNVQQKVPYYWIATQPGSAPLFSPEGNIALAAFAKLGFSAVMFPTGYMTIKNAAWDPTKHAVIETMVTASGGTGACSTKDGVTYTVVGHPEAVISYNGGGTATASGGVPGAWITIVTTGTLATPEFITITQTKAGCTVGLTASDKIFVTGRAPVAIGYRTATMAGEVQN